MIYSSLLKKAHLEWVHSKQQSQRIARWFDLTVFWQTKQAEHIKVEHKRKRLTNKSSNGTKVGHRQYTGKEKKWQVASLMQTIVLWAAQDKGNVQFPPLILSWAGQRCHRHSGSWTYEMTGIFWRKLCHAKSTYYEFVCSCEVADIDWIAVHGASWDVH